MFPNDAFNLHQTIIKQTSNSKSCNFKNHLTSKCSNKSILCNQLVSIYLYSSSLHKRTHLFNRLFSTSTNISCRKVIISRGPKDLSVNRDSKNHNIDNKNTNINNINSIKSNNINNIKNNNNKNRNSGVSGELTHLDKEGRLRMVDVGEKVVSRRVAVAKGVVWVPRGVMDAVRGNNVGKGDVLVAAKVAGVMAAKKTSDLIPLCHQIPLSKVHITFKLHCSDDHLSYNEDYHSNCYNDLQDHKNSKDLNQLFDTTNCKDFQTNKLNISSNSSNPSENSLINDQNNHTSFNLTPSTTQVSHSLKATHPKPTSIPKHDSNIEVMCEVVCEGRTGVEMEALVGVTVASLTIYDMVKAMSQHIVIGDVRLVKKTGGRSVFVNEF